MAELEIDAALIHADDVTIYVEQGRRYQALSDWQLSELWRAAMRALADDPLNDQKANLQMQIGVEFELRGAEAPYQSINDVVKRYFSETKRLMKAEDPDPEVTAQAFQEHMTRLERLRAKRRKTIS